MKRTDNNQQNIIKLARSVGAEVVCLSNLGHGCPDLLIGHRNKNYLIEVKNKSKLTPAQEKWFKTWPGQAKIVFNEQDLLSILFPKVN